MMTDIIETTETGQVGGAVGADPSAAALGSSMTARVAGTSQENRLAIS